jgi:omega-6 fatty acid desaturase (delta-12 desaturase)
MRIDWRPAARGFSVCGARGSSCVRAAAPAAQPPTSVIPYLLLSVVIYRTIGVSLVLVLLLAIPAAGLQVRTFICFTTARTDRSYRPNGPTHVWARCLASWSRAVSSLAHDHATQHATSGDLERRGVGDIATLTLAEYAARSWHGRLAYRVLATHWSCSDSVRSWR